MEVSVFSFTGIYEEEDFWRESAGEIAGDSRFPVSENGGSPSSDPGLPHYHDLTGIPGTNGYLSEDAASEIRRRLDRISFDRHGLYGLHFIDSGNSHYMTRLLTERLRIPYCLILIDHHPDLQPPAFGGLLSCGSWVRASLEEDPFLRQVLLIGPDRRLFKEALCDDAVDIAGSGSSAHGAASATVLSCELAGRKISLIPEAPLPELLSLLSGLLPEDLPVWISVDKDILSPEEVQTNWDQGGMRTSDLYALLAFLRDRTHPLGVDICGECDRSGAPSDHARFVRQNDTINRALMRQWGLLHPFSATPKSPTDKDTGQEAKC